MNEKVSDYGELNQFWRATTEYFVEYKTGRGLDVPDISDKFSSLPFRLPHNATPSIHSPFGTSVAIVTMFYQTVIFGHSIHRSDPGGKS